MSQSNQSLAEMLERLARAFPTQPVVWRITALSDDKHQAQVSPQLPYEVVIATLDEHLGKAGWSFSQSGIGTTAVSCTLTLQKGQESLSKSAVIDIVSDARETAKDALVMAAEYFGLGILSDGTQEFWVDYDIESGEILYEPELEADFASERSSYGSERAFSGFSLDTGQDVSDDVDMSSFSGPLVDVDAELQEDKSKSEGQQKIDSLVERLKAEGVGLEVAKLTVLHGGYGNNPDEARALYGKLRELLISKS